MLAMSVNDVPGWLVTIPPSGIGVPVAFTPGLVPHCDVFTAELLGVLLAPGLLLDELLLLHPAAISIASTAAIAAAARALIRCSRIPTCPHLLVVKA